MTESEVYNLAYKHAQQCAAKYKTDAATLAKFATGIARIESTFNPGAKNKSSTARGLMQMLICTQREVEKKHAKVPFAQAMFSCKSYPTATVSQSQDAIFNADYAMKLAVHYLGYQFKRYGNWNKAVHAYNQGSFPGGRKSDGANYASKVFKNLSSDDLAMAAQSEIHYKEYY